MKILFVVVALLCVIISGYVLAITVLKSPKTSPVISQNEQKKVSEKTSPESLTILAERMDTPWAIASLPTGGMLITERKGTIRLLTAEGQLQDEPVLSLSNVKEIGEGGLLGIAIHPEFDTNNYVYVYYTYSGNGNNTLNRVARYTLQNNKLINEKILVNGIPGASNHNGGRIIFGPDRNLYIGTGDAQEPSEAQNTKSLAGKILRVSDEGKPVSGNPFTNEVYSYGHRNVQGLAFDDTGKLWATEHGRSGAASGLDEINLIEPGKNYGWPEIEGDETRVGMVKPVVNSGPAKTWAPGGAVVIGNSLFFAGLRGAALYEATISGNTITEVTEHFSGEYGRIREVTKGPDGLLYMTTSNQDGRGRPTDVDDRIIRIDFKNSPMI